jgi:hypothetical protein
VAVYAQVCKQGHGETVDWGHCHQRGRSESALMQGSLPVGSLSGPTVPDYAVQLRTTAFELKCPDDADLSGDQDQSGQDEGQGSCFLLTEERIEVLYGQHDQRP